MRLRKKKVGRKLISKKLPFSKFSGTGCGSVILIVELSQANPVITRNLLDARGTRTYTRTLVAADLIAVVSVRTSAEGTHHSSTLQYSIRIAIIDPAIQDTILIHAGGRQ